MTINILTIKAFLKSIIRFIFNFLGFEIKRIQKNQTIKDPIHHNSCEEINRYYSDPSYIKTCLDNNHQLFFKDILNILIDKQIVLDGKVIADVGCGIGVLCSIILDFYKPQSIIGLEYSNKAIEAAKINCPNAEFGEINILDVDSHYTHAFDIVFCLEVLEHLEYPNLALKNLIQMVHEKGVLVISVPNGRKDTFLGHIHFWSPESWKLFINAHAKTFYTECFCFNHDIFNLAIIKKSVNYIS